MHFFLFDVLVFVVEVVSVIVFLLVIGNSNSLALLPGTELRCAQCGVTDDKNAKCQSLCTLPVTHFYPGGSSSTRLCEWEHVEAVVLLQASWQELIEDKDLKS